MKNGFLIQVLKYNMQIVYNGFKFIGRF